MILASLIATNNLSLPASTYCTDASCSIEAYAVALQAECITSQTWGMPTNATTTCSTFDDQLCVDLGTSSPFAGDAYNFTTSSSARCKSNTEVGEYLDCPGGDFAVLVGAWANYKGYDPRLDNLGAPYTANTVDCRIRYGNCTIVQTGNNPPYIRHGSFTISTTQLTAEDNAESISWWKAKYGGESSPFHFASAGDSDVTIGTLTAYLIQTEPVTYESAPFTNDTNRVARALERSFDAATLLAFLRAPNASTIEITTSTEIAIWTYDTKVLTILAAPLLATLLVLSRYWKVQSNYVVIGYDPLKIARRANDILASTIPSD
jgi:hypothetical protein